MPETPIPTGFRRDALAATAVIGGFCASFVIWGAVAQLEAGVVARGEVVPSGRVKTVQHLEGGIVAALYVKEGERVRQGQELLRLDDGPARSELAIQQNERAALEALVARLTAERDGLPASAMTPRTGVASVDSQVRLLEARRAALTQQREAYTARIAQARQEFAAWKGREAALRKSLDLAADETRMNQTLLTKNFVARPRVLQLQSREADLAATLEEAAAEMARTRQKITDSELPLVKLRSDWITNVLEELRKALESLAQTKEKESIAAARLARTRVVAPQDGRVQALQFVTLGGVVPAGGDILHIVPDNDDLVVEARILPDDIDAVRPGLPTRVRLLAYPVRSRQALKAVVTQVSADAVRDDKRNTSYFIARVEIRDKERLVQQQMVLSPGMQAQIEIATGKRSVLRYLFDPLVNSTRRAFREE